MATRKLFNVQRLSLDKFIERYATEDDCKRDLFDFRWPDGFVCPKCKNRTYCKIRSRNIYQCNKCHTQTSITAGTIFHGSNLPLTKWFLAIYLLALSKKAMPIVALSHHLDISYNAAWRLKNKIIKKSFKRGPERKVMDGIVINILRSSKQNIDREKDRHPECKQPYVDANELSDGRALYSEFARIDNHHRHRANPMRYIYCQINPDGKKCFGSPANLCAI